MSGYLGNLGKRDYLVLMHVSQFLGGIIPFAGFVAPIVLWSMKKDEDTVVDLHGRIIINWLITAFILAIVSAILIFVVVGIPMLIAIGICSIIFPIMGAVKASNNETWVYPMSFDIMGVRERMVDRWL